MHPPSPRTDMQMRQTTYITKQSTSAQLCEGTPKFDCTLRMAYPYEETTTNELATAYYEMSQKPLSILKITLRKA